MLFVLLELLPDAISILAEELHQLAVVAWWSLTAVQIVFGGIIHSRFSLRDKSRGLQCRTLVRVQSIA